MKRKCCQTTPRCSGCPVLLKREATRQGRSSTAPAVIGDVLRGRPERAYPPTVLAALRELDAARDRPSPTRAELRAA